MTNICTLVFGISFFTSESLDGGFFGQRLTPNKR